MTDINPADFITEIIPGDGQKTIGLIHKINSGSVRQQVLKFMEDNADKSFSSHDVAAQFPEDVARGVWHAMWWLRKSKQCHIILMWLA